MVDLLVVVGALVVVGVTEVEEVEAEADLVEEAIVVAVEVHEDLVAVVEGVEVVDGDQEVVPEATEDLRTCCHIKITYLFYVPRL